MQLKRNERTRVCERVRTLEEARTRKMSIGSHCYPNLNLLSYYQQLQFYFFFQLSNYQQLKFSFFIYFCFSRFEFELFA